MGEPCTHAIESAVASEAHSEPQAAPRRCGVPSAPITSHRQVGLPLSSSAILARKPAGMKRFTPASALSFTFPSRESSSLPVSSPSRPARSRFASAARTSTSSGSSAVAPTLATLSASSRSLASLEVMTVSSLGRSCASAAARTSSSVARACLLAAALVVKLFHFAASSERFRRHSISFVSWSFTSSTICCETVDSVFASFSFSVRRWASFSATCARRSGSALPLNSNVPPQVTQAWCSMLLSITCRSIFARLSLSAISCSFSWSSCSLACRLVTSGSSGLSRSLSSVEGPFGGSSADTSRNRVRSSSSPFSLERALK